MRGLGLMILYLMVSRNNLRPIRLCDNKSEAI
jgi:hypothetical protein